VPPPSPPLLPTPSLLSAVYRPTRSKRKTGIASQPASQPARNTIHSQRPAFTTLLSSPPSQPAVPAGHPPQALTHPGKVAGTATLRHSIITHEALAPCPFQPSHPIIPAVHRYPYHNLIRWITIPSWRSTLDISGRKSMVPLTKRLDCHFYAFRIANREYRCYDTNPSSVDVVRSLIYYYSGSHEKF